MWDGVLCNNYAKCKEEEGYLKSRTGVSVPRPPAAKIYPPIPKLCFLMEDGARRPPSYLKLPFLVVGGRGTETTVLLRGGYTKAAEDVCPRPLYWLLFIAYSLLFFIYSLLFAVYSFLFVLYSSVQRFTPIRC